MTKSKGKSPAPERASIHAKHAEFRSSATEVSQLPTDMLFEVAVVGRSNVGKSSLINRVCQKKKLARTSSTPGSTHELVVFSILVERGDGSLFEVRLVDLPGYGYAKRSKSSKNELSRIIQDYLLRRRGIGVLLILNDIRRDPEQEELDLAEHARGHGVPYLVIATKADKLTHSEKLARSKEVARCYGLDAGDIVLTGDGIPARSFWERIDLLQQAREHLAE